MYKLIRTLSLQKYFQMTLFLLVLTIIFSTQIPCQVCQVFSYEISHCSSQTKHMEEGFPTTSESTYTRDFQSFKAAYLPLSSLVDGVYWSIFKAIIEQSPNFLQPISAYHTSPLFSWFATDGHPDHLHAMRVHVSGLSYKILIVLCDKSKWP